MKLTLSQQELEQAVLNYVNAMINLSPNTHISIDFRAGRGENGISAEVDISMQSVTSESDSSHTVHKVDVVLPDPVQKGVKEPAQATRKASGKSLFGAGVGAAADTPVPQEEPVPMEEDDTEAEATSAEPSGGARKTLFS